MHASVRARAHTGLAAVDPAAHRVKREVGCRGRFVGPPLPLPSQYMQLWARCTTSGSRRERERERGMCVSVWTCCPGKRSVVSLVRASAYDARKRPDQSAERDSLTNAWQFGCGGWGYRDSRAPRCVGGTSREGRSRRQGGMPTYAPHDRSQRTSTRSRDTAATAGPHLPTRHDETRERRPGTVEWTLWTRVDTGDTCRCTVVPPSETSR
jgi:hypothetical protein